MDTLRKTVKFFPFKEDFCWLLWGFWCLFQLKITLSHFQDLNFGVSSRESGLPWGFSGKECACQCRRPGFDPWVRKIPWRRKWQPTPVFLPGKPHGQRSLASYRPWGHKESDMTEWLNNNRIQTGVWFCRSYFTLKLLPSHLVCLRERVYSLIHPFGCKLSFDIFFFCPRTPSKEVFNM